MKSISIFSSLILLVCVGSLELRAQTQPLSKKVQHPFLWWTKEEAAAIRKRLETDPEAKKQLEVTRRTTGEASGKAAPLWDLFQIAIYENEDAKARQLKELRKFMTMQPETDAGGRWVVGNASATDRHMRDEQSMNVLRYDLLYDELTDAEKVAIENSMRVYIEFQLSGHRPIHPHFGYGRTDTLPNMHWPRAIGTHLMAVALQDEKLIKDLWTGFGGWYWFFDQYLADGFYMEEFAKYYSNIGTMILVCEALEDLNLGDKYGYGYVSKSGATVKDFLFQPPRISYPPTEIPGGRNPIRVVEMGDTPGKSKLHGIFGHSFVSGYLPGQNKGGNFYFSGSRMNGPFPKMQAPLWCEAGHRRFPEAGFDYFLAAMRGPDEAKAYPTLYFGLEPIDPATVTPPAPQSIVSEQRGFAFLKADESPGYWSSGKPAVALQFGMYYVHYAHDCFSLLGYHALGRPLYARGWGVRSDHVKNESIRTGGKGYIGGHAWYDTPRGQAGGLTVDNLKPRPIDHGQNGSVHQRIRHTLQEELKFVAVAAEGLYPGVWQERGIFLTDEYMLDLYANRSERTRRYDWSVNGAGTLAMEGWKPSSELYGSMLYRDMGDPQPADAKPEGNDPREVHKLEAGDQAWSTHILQDYTGKDVNRSQLGAEWYERQIGVRISALGSENTEVFGGRPPLDGPYGETGGAWLNIRRETDNTNFVVLHEPFAEGKVPSTRFEKLVDREDLIGVRITGEGFEDVVFMATGKDVSTVHEVEFDGKTLKVDGFLWMRKRAGAKLLTHQGPGEVKLPAPRVLSEDPKEALVQKLSDPNTGTRENASIALGRMGSDAAEAIPVMMKGLTEKVTIGNKVAAETISWMGPVALPEIKKHLTHPDPYVRAELLYGLQSFDGDFSSLVPDLIPLLSDENRYVRRNATKVIIQLGPKAEAVVPALIELMSDPVNDRYAGYALSAIGPAVLPEVEKLLANPGTRVRALNILSGMGEQALPLADQVAGFLQTESQVAALKALASMGPQANGHAEAVLALLPSQNGDLINQVANTLVAMQPLPASLDPVPALTAVMKGPEDVYRKQVILALKSKPSAASQQAIVDIVRPGSFRIDDKQGYPFLMKTVLDVAPEDEDVQAAMAGLFVKNSGGKRKGKLSKERDIPQIIAHPNFPVERYRDELEGLLGNKRVGLSAAAVLLSVDAEHPQASAKLTEALVQTNPANLGRQRAARAAAWKLVSVANRSGWNPEWENMLASSDPQIQSLAISALKDNEKAFATYKSKVIPMLDSKNTSVALAAAELFSHEEGEISERAIAVFMTQAGRADWRVRADMIGRLGTLGKGHEDQVIPQLRLYAKHSDFFTRKAAESALYQISQSN